MSQYRKKPVVITAITFAQLVAHGIAQCEEDGRESNIVNGMPWSFSYNGHPITHENDDCYIIPTLEGSMKMGRDDMLITGVKREIYPCKREIFEATYEPADLDASSLLLDFGSALGLLKQGVPVARLGWNGKGMFAYYVPAASYPAQTGVAKEYFGENAMVPYNAYMAIKNVDNTVSTWVPSVNDCLAEDWVIVGEAVASEVPPHQQRVLDERVELKDRHQKLGAFIFDNPVFLSLPEAEKARLQKQEDLQSQLLGVLDERIAAF